VRHRIAKLKRVSAEATEVNSNDDGRGYVFAKRINNGQSEIWLGQNGKDLTPRRTLASNEVLYITRRLCAQDVFETFHADYSKAIDRIAT
jgi:hypothetical protein